MYELVGHKNWNQSIDPIEFLTYKNKATELEELIEKLQQEKEKLKENNTSITLSLNCKEKELIAKNRELIDYKNRSTLEMCKLINQIDSLKRSLETQSQIFDHKIFEAQSSMDDEVVRITTKLEDQYQKDLKLNIENMQSNFERIANLPANTIENLLRMCESDNIDWITLQESWEQQRNALCNKILTLETMHNKEIAHIKNSYETKMVYLKTQVDSLSIQLNERKKILDIFESEIMGCKGNTIIKLLGPPVAVEDISYLKELYKSEIFAEQQIHKLEINIFENKVKNLSEEILYHAKNEENHLQELESTRKMADIYREKYESLAIEWEERVSKQLSDLFEESVDKLGIDDIFEQIKNLMYSLKKAEEIQEERLTKLQKFYDNEISSYKRDIEIFKSKILELELFQNDQLKLDSTIQELIENVGSNYVNTVEAMVTCHVTELSLKQLEIYSIEKKFVNEITALKNNHQKEINILQNQLLGAEESKLAIEKELGLLRKSCRCHEVDSLKMKTEEITLELLRHEGMIAIKEETENALNKRIKELENLINLKEENCRKEVENLVAKLVEINVISSAKDDLTRELEEKLNNSEKLLEKTSREVDNLQEICSLLEEKLKNAFKDCVCDKGDFIQNTDIIDKFSLMQTKAEQLESRFLEIFEKMDYLKEENKKLKLNQDKVLAKSKQQILEKNKKLEMDLSSAMREKKEVFEENCKLQVEKNSLLEKLAEKDKILVERNVEKENMLKACSELPQFKKNYEDVANKLEILEAEKLELIKREKIISTEKEMVEKRNKDLEERLRFMNERMDDLMIEFENNKKSDEQGTVSFSLQEVRVLYAEETIEVDNSESATMISGQEKKFRSNSLEYLKYDELYKENKELMEENNSLKAQLKEKKTNLDLSQVQRMGNCKEMILKFRKELSEVTTERNGWMKVAKNLEKERECLREEIENLRKENRNIRAKNSNYEVTLKTFEEKTDCSIEQLVEESDLKESEVNEMKKEIGLLSNYINTLSVKLKEMKANNEKLLRESNAYLRNNEDLSNELEEAWTDRYEIEDQLAKLRRENAFLNMHAAQLEDTNKRISNFVTQGKPSNVSWIKIHKTVENIIDEVLSLKTSFDDGECALPQPGNFDVSKTPSEMRLITESLQAQLQNKKILCDELLIQKKTLEKELKDLEESLKQNDSRFLSQRLFSRESLCSRKSSSDIQNKQVSMNTHYTLAFRKFHLKKSLIDV